MPTSISLLAHTPAPNVSLDFTTSTPAELPLHKLPVKRCGTVTRLDLSADHQSGSQLVAMGVCIGRQIEVIKPGDPLIIRVLGSRIGLSARLAQQIWVHACTAPACHTET